FFCNFACFLTRNLVMPYFLGGWQNQPLATVEILNTDDNTITTINNGLQTARYGLATSAIGSNIYTFGGDPQSLILPFFDTISLFNTLTNTDMNLTTPKLVQGVYDPAVARVGNLIYIGGGSTSLYNVSDTIYIFNSVAGTVTVNPNRLAIPSGRLAAASVGNFIYFAGGVNKAEFILDSIQVFNTVNGTIVKSPLNLSNARLYLAATSVGNKVYFAGGSNGNIDYKEINVLDASTQTISLLANNLLTPRSGLVAVSVGSKIYFAAGFSGNGSQKGVFLSDVNIYDTNLDQWE
ncbi:MAG: hypothetical protein QM528_06920, partial [Phycisphaerales bacterium]|nr:hypothetical protein [Phycisphaerales bacterium]